VTDEPTKAQRSLLERIRDVASRPFAAQAMKRTFTRKFEKHVSLEMDALSGPGSDLAQTRAVRAALPTLLRELNVRTMLDVPCGDLFWMKTLDLNVDYVGADIVEPLIERNTRQFANARRRFVQLDLQRDALPKVDLVFCRDCLVHFPLHGVALALSNIKRSGSRYLLTTTFVDRASNDDIRVGRWRPLNLERAPFDLPPPLRLMDEECPEPTNRDKRLGLWRIDALPDVAVD
jgi:SAM-dependent methyltransferase